MIKSTVSLVACLASVVLSAQLTLIDVSNTPHPFDLSSLEITFSGGSLITNQGYSAPVTSLREGTFETIVSNKTQQNIVIQNVSSLRYADGYIKYTPQITGISSVQVFNAAGQRIEVLFNGSTSLNNEVSLPFNKTPGTYYVHMTSKNKSETYVIGVQ